VNVCEQRWVHGRGPAVLERARSCVFELGLLSTVPGVELGLLAVAAPLEVVPPVAPLELVAGAVVLQVLWLPGVLWVSCWGTPLEVYLIVLGGVGSREGWCVGC